MTTVQKRYLGIGVVLVMVAIALFVWFKPDQTPYVPLISYDLTQKQRVEVEHFLQKEGYDFQEKDNQILVHQDQLETILVEMGKAGVPSR